MEERTGRELEPNRGRVTVTREELAAVTNVVIVPCSSHTSLKEPSCSIGMIPSQSSIVPPLPSEIASSRESVLPRLPRVLPPPPLWAMNWRSSASEPAMQSLSEAAAPAGLVGFLRRVSSRASSLTFAPPQVDPAAPPSTHGSSRGEPVCLICLEEVTPGDWEAGNGMRLECGCQGPAAVRHRDCALKWIRTKAGPTIPSAAIFCSTEESAQTRLQGNATCDICRQRIRNLETPESQGESA